MADVELVIKIPEIEYEHIVNKEKFYSLEKSKREWLINKTLIRVINGTPLDKIRAEVEQLPITDTAVRLVVEVIDRYMESER